MKKYFYIGLALVVGLSVLLVAYGAYLNYTSEKIIAVRMNQRALELQGERVKVRSIKPAYSLDTLELMADTMLDVPATVQGRISRVFVKQNSTVKAGDPLFQINNESLEWQIRQIDSEILKARALAERAKATFDRYKVLVDSKAISREQYDAAKVDSTAAWASVSNLEARRGELVHKQQEQTVKSPVDGEIILLYQQLGSYVGEGTALALIGDFHNLYFTRVWTDNAVRGLGDSRTVKLFFREDDMKKIYDSRYESHNEEDTGWITGKIVMIEPDPSVPATMRKIRVDVSNGKGVLEPKTYHNVLLDVEKTLTTLTIPLTALLPGSETAVFTVGKNNRLERRVVELGVEGDAHIEVLSGLKEGDIVIVSATDGLQEGTKVNVSVVGEQRK